MSTCHIKTISLNPFYAAKILQNFLDGYGGIADYKVLFYVLPIIMYKDSREKLLTANSRSRIDSLFGGKDIYPKDQNVKISRKTNLSGFIERFNALNNLTKQAIIVLVNEEKIGLSSNVVLLKKDNYTNYEGDIWKMLRASYYLGSMFSKSTISYLDNFLGVSLTCKAI